MADYLKEERVGTTADGRPVTRVVERRSGGGASVLIGILLIAAVVIAVLFATGFWKLNVEREGALPTVDVRGGQLPKVDVDSKKVVVGTKKTTVDVPTVGVKDDDKK